VDAAINKGLVPPELQNSYERNISRKDFCHLVVNLLTVKMGKSIYEILEINGKQYKLSELIAAFYDTDDEKVYCAYKLGIVNGRGNRIFDPDGYITREEAAVMLHRTAMVLGFTEPNGTPQYFNDSDKFSSWAINGIFFASSATDRTNGNRVMGGTGNGNFSPKGYYTRQQAYITMIRLYNAMD